MDGQDNSNTPLRNAVRLKRGQSYLEQDSVYISTIIKASPIATA